MIEKRKILNIDILNLTQKKLLEILTTGVLITPNVDHLIKLQKNIEFYKAYNNSDWIICDSKIVSLASKFLGSPIKEVIPGSSFFPAFYNYHKNNKDIKIFLLGAAEGVAMQAMENINKKIGRNIIVNAHSPSFGFERNKKECLEIVELVKNSEATVLVVGVGAPKQEIWINEYKDCLPTIKIFMALGATIDFEAGNIKRAPKIFQKFALEWFYRMCIDPKRLVKRYLIEDLPFFYYLLKQKLGLYKNPFENES